VIYLADANILSEPTKPQPAAQAVKWLYEHERDIVVDPIVLGELRFGILLLPKGRRRTALEAWFDGLTARVQCLAWEAETGLRWAQLLADLRRSGRAMPVKDSMIAATALVHDLLVATRNSSDFANAGVKTVNPFLPPHRARQR
jgi:toxin FitB